MSNFGIGALKWLFESNGVEKIINGLERCKQRISLALQVDQTELILSINKKIDPAKLPSAEGAAFDSHLGEHTARYLPDIRTGLLHEISEGAEDVQGKCIFWPSGIVGASFFLKRGAGDRGMAAGFFTTIAAQLVTKLPSLGPYIREAIDADPEMPEKALNN